MRINNFTKKKQTGVTLITSMMLLVIMTVVGVSATKVSSMSLLIAGSDQQKMIISQKTNSELTRFARIDSLEKTFTASGFSGNVNADTNKYTFTQTNSDGLIVDKEITDMTYNYACKRNGQASNIGGDAPKCALYNFKVEVRGVISSASDRRNQGSGKMVPSIEHSSDITQGVYNLVD